MNVIKAETPSTRTQSYPQQFVLFIIENLSQEKTIVGLKKKVEKQGYKEIYRFSTKVETTDDLTEFKTELQKAIVKTKSNNSFLLLSHFKPFEKDTSLPAMRLLVNSGIDFIIDDFPSLNKDTLKVLLETYNRRKKSGRKVSGSTARKENAISNLNKPRGKEDRIRRKIQSVYLDHNNQMAIKHLINTKDLYSYTDTSLAYELTQANILTPRGNAHSQKSVSRLKKRLKTDLEPRYKRNLNQEASLQRQLDFNNLLTKDYSSSLPSTTKARDTLPKHDFVNVINDNEENKFTLSFKDEVTGENFKGIPDFEKEIIFNFGDQWKSDLLISIKISSSIEGEEVFSFTVNDCLPKRYVLAIRDTYLLPGIQFLEVEAKGFKKEKMYITLLNDLNPIDKN